MKRILLVISLVTAELLVTRAPTTAALVDDHQISIHTESGLKLLRQHLIQFIWGQERLPDRMPDNVALAESPMTNVDNLEKVESILISMDAGQQTIAYRYLPRTRNSRLVIVHQGHSCETGAAGVGNVIRDLVRSGYSVLAMNMPRCRTGDCSADCTGAHNEMFASIHLSKGSPLRFFLEPIAVCLNYLQSHRAEGTRYTDFNMA